MREKAIVSRRWTVPSELGQEKSVVRELTRAIREAELTEPRLEEIATAVSEACLNAIEHGNGLSGELPVRVTMRVYANRYTILVCDRGRGADIDGDGPFLTVRQKLDWQQPRGWGLQLMHQYADSVRGFRRKDGFCVELNFARHIDKEGGRHEERTGNLGESI